MITDIKKRIRKSRAKIHFCVNCNVQFIGKEGCNSKYCIECRTVECICLGCNCKFNIKRKDFNDGRGRYCNMKCYINNISNKFVNGERHPNWKGGISFQHGYHCKYSKDYLARKRNADGSFTLQEWKDVKNQYKHRCLCCGKFEPYIVLTADHIIPLSKGGRNSIENIQPLCRSCNSKKYTNTISYIKNYVQNIIGK